MQNQQQVFAQNQNMADYRDQAFQFNKVNPYYEGVSESQGYIGAGMQNMGSGFNSGAGASMDFGGGNGSGGKSVESSGSQYGNMFNQQNKQSAFGFNGQTGLTNPYRK